jgi:hypothetical protein
LVINEIEIRPIIRKKPTIAVTAEANGSVVSGPKYANRIDMASNLEGEENRKPGQRRAGTYGNPRMESVIHPSIGTPIFLCV